MRARQVNAYYNSLGEGLGGVVPAPGGLGLGQAAVDRLRGDRGGQGHLRPPRPRGAGAPRRPRPEERRGRPRLAVDGRPREIDDARPAVADRGRGRRLEPSEDDGPAAGEAASDAGAAPEPRVVLGVTGGIAAYKAVEVCRRLVEAGVLVVAGPDRDAIALRRRGHLLGARPPSRSRRASSTRRSPIPHTRLGQRRRPRRGGAGHRRLPGPLRGRDGQRPVDGDAAGHPGPGRRVSGHAHRDVGAPERAGEPGHPAPPGRAVVDPESGRWPPATRAWAGWPIRPPSWRSALGDGRAGPARRPGRPPGRR